MFALSYLAVATIHAGSVSGIVTDHGKPVSQAVVWLDGPVHVDPEVAVVDQRKRAFIPHIQVVPVGSRVDFPNNDDVFHNVFAEFQAKRFDLGMYPRGTKKSVTFDKPGIVSIRCNIHANMSAFMVVVNTPYYAITNSQGKFTMKGVSPRHYTLHAWAESGKTSKIPVDATSPISGLQAELVR
jgi:plastocyanin